MRKAIKAMKAKASAADHVRNNVQKIFKIKIPAGDLAATTENILRAANITVPKMRQIAALYNMNKIYQEASKATSRRAFVVGLLKKLA